MSRPRQVCLGSVVNLILLAFPDESYDPPEEQMEVDHYADIESCVEDETVIHLRVDLSFPSKAARDEVLSQVEHIELVNGSGEIPTIVS